MSNPILRYACAESPIGTLLVAASDTGVAAILIDSDPDRLRHELATAWPEATLVEDETAVAGAIDSIQRFLADPSQLLEFALDLQGSKAERAVWSALRTIPVGETRSYGQIAKALPVSVTAQEVGAACAANVLALAIPCHRVIKADGGISGYRWGVARKRRLLALEAAA
jgi:AraC family transcriptional regulator of adaptative response/methylated-DNA-[protein]-cysteine methyltransferase